MCFFVPFKIERQMYFNEKEKKREYVYVFKERECILRVRMKEIMCS